MNRQSDGKNSIKRIEFVFHGKSYKFTLNPEEYNQSEPNRVNVTQTKAGAWSDEFGAGVSSINMKGTTGFKNGTSDGSNGYKKFKELRDFIRSVYNRSNPGTAITPHIEMQYYNYTDGEHWVVTPKIFELSRSIARPLMYVYNIQLICLRPGGQPSATDRSTSSTSISPRVRRL